MKLTKEYEDVFDLWKRYWRAYGGAKDFRRSPYVHFALLTTLVLTPSWVSRGWWDTVTSVLPNVLGFTLGGYAILISFGDEKFKAILTATESDALEKDHSENATTTAFLGVSAAFLHFIVVQIGALLVALIAKAGNSVEIAHLSTLHNHPSWRSSVTAVEYVGSAVGYFLFVYALCTALAASMYIFRMSSWFEAFQASEEKKRREEDLRRLGGTDPGAQDTRSSQN